MGFGDVKYAAASGLLLGFYYGIASFISATVLAIAYALLISANSPEWSIKKIKIPYGTFLSISTILFFILQLVKRT
jgi:prepilin signal peptidase PulO-like enzyme (type II secretory pathway)